MTQERQPLDPAVKGDAVNNDGGGFPPLLWFGFSDDIQQESQIILREHFREKCRLIKGENLLFEIICHLEGNAIITRKFVVRYM